MNRLLSSAAVGIALLLAAACGGDDPDASSSPNNDGVALPASDQFVDVPVTKPANPQPVEVGKLPSSARAISLMPGLSAAEKTCANAAVKGTIDGDPSIATTNAKMASVLGNSVVVCTTPDRLATVVSGAMAPEGQHLTPEQQSCLQKSISADTRGTARFLAAVLTVNPKSIMAESQRYDDACRVDVAPG
jgi:hypothetical protein